MSRRSGYHHPIETRIRMGASALGIDPYDYARHLDAGEKWCAGHKVWEPIGNFGRHARTANGLNTQCREADRIAAREYQRRKRARP